MKLYITIISFICINSIIIFGCRSNEKNNSNDVKVNKDYLKVGKKYVATAQETLSNNLTEAIAAGGPAHAIDFCNTKAIELTDSISKELKVKIKRVSNRNRNPLNATNKEEQINFQQWKSDNQNGKNLSPVLREMNGKALGYYPIITNQLCLMCHGVRNKDITKETQQVLDRLYPADKAFDYTANELRGMFVVEMDTFR